MMFKIEDNVPIPTGPEWVEVDIADAAFVVGDYIPGSGGFVVAVRFAPDCVRYLVADRAKARRCCPDGW